jgi:hypothetical protein
MSSFDAHVLSNLIDQDLGCLIPSGGLPPEATYKQIAANRLREALLKKHASEIAADADDKALKKFLRCNESCSSWTMDSNRSLVEDVILGEMREEIYRFWMKDGVTSLCDDVTSLLNNAKHGPGASSGGFGDDFYTKQFSGPLCSSSPGLVLAYQQWIDARRTWRSAEMRRAWEFGRITTTSYLTFVPKSNEISRTICVEPMLNMFFQQGFRSLLEDRLRERFGINLLDQQTKNRVLARNGSIDGGLATIDLSSASDSIGLKMLEWLLPRDFMSWLKLLRCPKSRLPSGDLIDLHMVSTMGNAFTFPLQCIIFASCIKAVFRVMEIPWRPHPGFSRVDWSTFSRNESPNVGVNGDDLIVPSVAYKTVCRVLTLLGFTVNAEKSFSEGYFRESCGADWFRGKPCRGYYLDDESAPNAPYVAWNRLSYWSAQVGIPLPRSLSYLLRCARRIEVPWDESDSAGFKVANRSRKQSPQNGDGSFIYSRLEPRLRELTFVPDLVSVDCMHVRVPKSERKKRVFNPFGYLIAYLGGYITSDTVTLRDKRVQWRVRNCVWPSSWEYTRGGAEEAPDPLALRCARSTD